MQQSGPMIFNGLPRSKAVWADFAGGNEGDWPMWSSMARSLLYLDVWG